MKNRQVGLWGHPILSRSVYGNNPQQGGKRQSKPSVVWDVVKHLKETTTHVAVVDVKYTHVCVVHHRHRRG